MNLFLLGVCKNKRALVPEKKRRSHKRGKRAKKRKNE